jgi:hypothetical protein
MKKMFFSLILFIVVSNVEAQDGLSIRVNSGLISEFEIADGYYFSFDVGIPIVKSIEFAPTFSYYMVSSNTKEHTFMNNYSIAPSDGFKGFNYSDTSGIIDLMLIFKPVELFSTTSRKHNLGLGLSVIGLGYHTQLRTNVNDGIIDSFSYYQGSYISYLHAKVFYNYRFTETISSGLILGTQAGNYPYFGVQFGLNVGNNNNN